MWGVLEVHSKHYCIVTKLGRFTGANQKNESINSIAENARKWFCVCCWNISTVNADCQNTGFMRNKALKYFSPSKEGKEVVGRTPPGMVDFSYVSSCYWSFKWLSGVINISLRRWKGGPRNKLGCLFWKSSIQWVAVKNHKSCVFSIWV